MKDKTKKTRVVCEKPVNEMESNNSRLLALQNAEDDLNGISRGSTLSGTEFWKDKESNLSFNGPVTFMDLVGIVHQSSNLHSLTELSLSNMDSLKNFIRMKIGCSEFEIFSAIWFDRHKSIITYEDIAMGDKSSVRVSVKQIVRRAIDLNADSVVFAHNHPSGLLGASKQDKDLSSELLLALGGIKIQVVDHIIVSSSESYSMREHGELKIFTVPGHAEDIGDGQ